jgi:hypothetical protein
LQMLANACKVGQPTSWPKCLQMLANACKVGQPTSWPKCLQMLAKWIKMLADCRCFISCFASIFALTRVEIEGKTECFIVKRRSGSEVPGTLHTSIGGVPFGTIPLPSGRVVSALMHRIIFVRCIFCHLTDLSEDVYTCASGNLVDPASCHMLVSRTKPCKCQSTRVLRREVCVRLIKRFIVYPTEKCLVLFRWDNDLEMNR